MTKHCYLKAWKNNTRKTSTIAEVGRYIRLEFELEIRLGRTQFTFITGVVPLNILAIDWTLEALKTFWQSGKAPEEVNLQWSDPSSHMTEMVYLALPVTSGEGGTVAKPTHRKVRQEKRLATENGWETE